MEEMAAGPRHKSIVGVLEFPVEDRAGEPFCCPLFVPIRIMVDGRQLTSTLVETELLYLLHSVLLDTFSSRTKARNVNTANHPAYVSPAFFTV